VFSYYQLKAGRWQLGAIALDTGETLWSIRPPRSEHGTDFSHMYAHHGRLYLALDWRLEVIDANTGASIGVVW